MKEGGAYNGILHTAKLASRGISFVLKMAKKVCPFLSFLSFLIILSFSNPLTIFSLIFIKGRRRTQEANWHSPSRLCWRPRTLSFRFQMERRCQLVCFRTFCFVRKSVCDRQWFELCFRERARACGLEAALWRCRLRSVAFGWGRRERPRAREWSRRVEPVWDESEVVWSPEFVPWRCVVFEKPFYRFLCFIDYSCNFLFFVISFFFTFFSFRNLHNSSWSRLTTLQRPRSSCGAISKRNFLSKFSESSPCWRERTSIG